MIGFSKATYLLALLAVLVGHGTCEAKEVAIQEGGRDSSVAADSAAPSASTAQSQVPSRPDRDTKHDAFPSIIPNTSAVPSMSTAPSVLEPPSFLCSVSYEALCTALLNNVDSCITSGCTGAVYVTARFRYLYIVLGCLSAR